jgi:16S rRNA (guanine966-N2)-methyltransferase
VRIVAGAAKGRGLATPASATRPTSDRVREALFNTVQARVRLANARVLDLYAGTGAVGLEALSRGAAEAVFVENDRRALAVLRRNIATVGLPGASVVGRAVTAFLEAGAAEPFDLVFADPPYAMTEVKLGAVLASLAGRGWVGPDTLVVVEYSARNDVSAVASTLLTPALERRYGDTVLWYGRPR